VPGQAIILFTAASTLAAQSVPDARQILDSSIAVTQRTWKVRLKYTYLEHDVDRRLDSAGRVVSEKTDVSRTTLVDGVPFERLVERNGHPLPSEEEKKENEKLAKLKRESPEQRAQRLRKEEDENASLVREVPKAFDLQLVGEESINGRPAYVIQAKPHPGFQAEGKYGKMYAKVEGRIWIDKQDLAWVKVDGQVMQPVSMGFFLVRLMRGSEIKMQQMRVDSFWMPERVEIRAAARIFFVKSILVERVLTYSEYKLAQP
jgi:hypothetical protein